MIKRLFKKGTWRQPSRDQMGLCGMLASMTFADDVALLYRSIQHIPDVLMDLSVEYIIQYGEASSLGIFFLLFLRLYQTPGGFRLEVTYCLWQEVTSFDPRCMLPWSIVPAKHATRRDVIGLRLPESSVTDVRRHPAGTGGPDAHTTREFWNGRVTTGVETCQQGSGKLSATG